MPKYDQYETKDYLKSIRRETVSGEFKGQAQQNLITAINFLREGRTLPTNFRDHQLTGKWQGFRDCHIKGDLILIYKIDELKKVVILQEFGSHNYLGL